MPLRAGESNYTETGVETGLAGALLLHRMEPRRCSSRSCAPRGLPRTQTFRVAAAGGAAALAAVLALAVQTDAYGVPWLAYSLWWLCGALVDVSDRG